MCNAVIIRRFLSYFLECYMHWYTRIAGRYTPGNLRGRCFYAQDVVVLPRCIKRKATCTHHLRRSTFRRYQILYTGAHGPLLAPLKHGIARKPSQQSTSHAVYFVIMYAIRSVTTESILRCIFPCKRMVLYTTIKIPHY